MKTFLTIFAILIGQLSMAQFYNTQFSDWEMGTDAGEEYEIPSYWFTNNGTQENGFATTPVTKVTSNINNGYIAKIESNLNTTSTLEKGFLFQESNSAGLEQIWYMSKCDSLYQGGSCRVSILGDTDVLFSDTTFVVEDSFSIKHINIPSQWQNTYEKLTLLFEAVGRTIPESPESSSYSVFLIEEVGFDIILNTKENNLENNLSIAPNPVSNTLNIDIGKINPEDKIRITNMLGNQIYEGIYSPSVDVSKLANGSYVISHISKESVVSKQFLKID